MGMVQARRVFIGSSSTPPLPKAQIVVETSWAQAQLPDDGRVYGGAPSRVALSHECSWMTSVAGMPGSPFFLCLDLCRSTQCGYGGAFTSHILCPVLIAP